MANSNAKDDAIKILMADHKKVKAAFKQFEELGDKAFVSKKKLADEICMELLVHTQVEEEILYPVFVKNIKKEKPLVNEAVVEHSSAKVLIGEILDMKGDEELFDARVKVLSEYIDHHVKEEEKEMFPLMRSADIDLVAVGSQIKERKQQLMVAG
ncbi:hemerythrin [Pseudohongiella acticola]|uniref:Hemerythrin n=1 Tax=Pseudohongiella acticola TaxID=1524254 RepID=A0A1E8CG63_9GAMM|nr:hemerythrin domain-containing protein [Pseudohongiella acticola]OFE11342.1 hemerythrin [Pseudohongiella acticola]